MQPPRRSHAYHPRSTSPEYTARSANSTDMTSMVLRKRWLRGSCTGTVSPNSLQDTHGRAAEGARAASGEVFESPDQRCGFFSPAPTHTFPNGHFSTGTGTGVNSIFRRVKAEQPGRIRKAARPGRISEAPRPGRMREAPRPGRMREAPRLGRIREATQPECTWPVAR